MSNVRTWRQIEHVLADYFRMIGVEPEAAGNGELLITLDDQGVGGGPETVTFSDLAQYLERELTS